MPGTDVICLASLLDDEDETTAVNALAELLNRSEELGELPALLQESDNPLVRRRAHQLQAALLLRQRRRDFFQLLSSPEPSLAAGLIAVHLLWFDKDSPPAIAGQWQALLTEARRRPMGTLEEIVSFLHRMNFAPELETTLRPENYCIGTILEQKYGSGALLAGIARETADHPEEFRIVRLAGEFGISDGSRLLLGSGDWRIVDSPGVEHLEFWSVRSLLRYAGNTLLSCAVNSDSFRYVLTIAQALSGDTGDGVLDYFPYPYRPAEEPEEDNQEQEESSL